MNNTCNIQSSFNNNSLRKIWNLVLSFWMLWQWYSSIVMQSQLLFLVYNLIFHFLFPVCLIFLLFNFPLWFSECELLFWNLQSFLPRQIKIGAESFRKKSTNASIVATGLWKLYMIFSPEKQQCDHNGPMFFQLLFSLQFAKHQQLTGFRTNLNNQPFPLKVLGLPITSFLLTFNNYPLIWIKKIEHF